MAKGNVTHYFNEQRVFTDREQRHIERTLRQFKGEPATEELKKKIWNALQTEKHLGHIITPFKVVLRQDPLHKFPPTVEVILDTKV